MSYYQHFEQYSSESRIGHDQHLIVLAIMFDLPNTHVYMLVDYRMKEE